MCLCYDGLTSTKYIPKRYSIIGIITITLISDGEQTFDLKTKYHLFAGRTEHDLTQEHTQNVEFRIIKLSWSRSLLFWVEHNQVETWDPYESKQVISPAHWMALKYDNVLFLQLQSPCFNLRLFFWCWICPAGAKCMWSLLAHVKILTQLISFLLIISVIKIKPAFLLLRFQ